MLRLSVLACIVLIIWLLPTESRTYIVDNDGFADYKEIGKAVLAAGNGDTIYIKPGVYTESFILNKSLNLMPLMGEKGDIVLKGDGKDIGVKITANGCSIEGMTFKNFNKAGIEILSSGNTIKGSKFENDNPALLIDNADQNVISNNIMIDCRGGVALKYGSRENTITKNEINGGIVSIYFDGVDGNRVLNNYLAGASMGIWLENSSNLDVTKNKIISKKYGILAANSSTGKLKDNTAVRSIRGIYLMNATGLEINNNSIKDVELGITLESSKENAIVGCQVINSSNALSLGLSSKNTIAENSIIDAKDTAINIGYSDNNVFTGNLISKGVRGILITDSSANKLQDNVLENIKCGLYVDGESFENYNNSIDESNEIDGKPIAYFYGLSDRLIQHRDLAHLTLAYCDNFTVDDNNITNDALALFGSSDNKILNNNLYSCYGGMLLLNSRDNLVYRNKISNSSYSGIFLVSSDSNVIRENNALKNNQMGISLLNSTNNTLRDNAVDYNHDTGIWLNLSKGNKIFENNISKNAMGVQLMLSTGNEIYHNNFIGNKEQAEDRAGNNQWDLGNVTGGNYWSDHTADGNPSTGWAKVIRGAKKDNYPFQDISGWFKANESAETTEDDHKI